MAVSRTLTKHQNQFSMQPPTNYEFGRTADKQHAFNIFPEQDTYAKRNCSN